MPSGEAMHVDTTRSIQTIKSAIPKGTYVQEALRHKVKHPESEYVVHVCMNRIILYCVCVVYAYGQVGLYAFFCYLHGVDVYMCSHMSKRIYQQLAHIRTYIHTYIDR